jgi:hypothetical protein
VNPFGLAFAQFKEITWALGLPNFICDLVYYISGFSMQQFLKERQSKKEDESRKEALSEHIRNERSKASALG